ncbi:MAG: CRISPR-associated helicase Cas3' [Ruminococcus sp.]|nr:CRISPR-associated helicase Cas3' [Ruminococcus sp.]
MFIGDFMKYAHKKDGKVQTIKEHLIGTAEKAVNNSKEFMKPMAYTLGIAHDIGKYADDFQKRLDGSSVRYEHSACGAIELGNLATATNQEDMTYMLQYCIAGHHTGLPDGGTPQDFAETDATLHARLKRKKNYIGTADYSSYKDEIELKLPDYTDVIEKLSESANEIDFFEKYAFFTRYLFSCLTDADFIDTEQFCNPDIDRNLKYDFEKVEEAVDNKFKSFIADTPLKKARNILQEQAINNSSENEQISILNMPTGSGKTLCSMKIALKKLREHNKKRIIYVIPYTSIIEQTAEIFEDIFGEYTDIVQHHSNYCYDSDNDNDTTAEKLKRSTENWDAPVIITTSVQFFQSLYHYKSSGLRKLHNMADSVIIFDEVHMIPIECIQPCLRGIGYITKYLNSEVVFLSATMPDYSGFFTKYTGNSTFKELIPDKTAFSFFKKCRYSYIGETELESVVEKSNEYNSSLIIVNSRKTARKIYGLLTGKKYHLSTYMTPNDRSDIISQIRCSLENGEKISVVSTSLVEAGVDLDFEVVFRQLAGLDNILQSGGRCNREGKRECGEVFVFETDEKLRGDIKVRASIVKDMLDSGMDIDSDKSVKEYYRRIFKYNDEIIGDKTIASKTNGLDRIPFRTYSDEFKYINEETVSVVINNNEETEKLFLQLEYGHKNVRRKLQRYSVSLKIKGEFDKALSLGLLHDTGKGIYVLADNSYYDEQTGLDIDKENNYIF